MTVQISASSTPYASDQVQRLLAMIFQNPSGGAGQEVPGADDGSSATPSASGPAPAQAQLASQTLSGLLAAQQSQPPTASDLAQQMISSLDTDGDGQLSLSEIDNALGADSTTSDSQIASAVSQLDTNGDGKLSASELTSGLQAAKAHGGGHHHHHAGGASSTDLASQLISGADGNGDGVLSPDEVAQALGIAAPAASTASTPSDAFSQLFSQMDANGDGSLSASELTSAIDAFRMAHDHSQSGQATQTSVSA
jgi:Ca2+-binding EF-hand superfamily protein